MSFLIFRQWKHLPGAKAKRGTDKQKCVGLIDEETSATDNFEETEENSSFELRPLKSPQGRSSTKHYYQEFQF